jgi:hypothetical protein
LSFASLSSYLIPGALVSLLLGSWAYSGNVRTVFPQIAIGDSVTTTIDLANKGVARFDGYLVVSGNNGYYLPVLIDGHQVLSDYALSVPAGGTLRLELSGTGTATPGHAWVYDNSVSGSIDMDATLDGTATFKIKNGAIQVDAIGVAESGHADHAFVLAEYGPDVDTGLAVSNLSQGNATITLKAKSETGQSLGTGSFVLGPYQHRAAFMHEYMTLSGSFTGTLEIESTQPVFPLALKLQNGQLSALGFCSMPALYDFEVSMKKGTRFRGELTLRAASGLLSGIVHFTSPESDPAAVFQPIVGTAVAGSMRTHVVFFHPDKSRTIVTLTMTSGFSTQSPSLVGDAVSNGTVEDTGSFTATRVN